MAGAPYDLPRSLFFSGGVAIAIVMGGEDIKLRSLMTPCLPGPGIAASTLFFKREGADLTMGLDTFPQRISLSEGWARLASRWLKSSLSAAL